MEDALAQLPPLQKQADKRAHQPTDDKRRDVFALALQRMSLERIAQHAEISLSTLLKHYGDVLDLAGRNPRGQQPYEPNYIDRVKVMHWARVGTPQEVIAKELGICIDTLAKYYGEELEDAIEKGVADVAATLYSKALMGDTGSMIFYLKTRGRWRESSIGDEDNPLHIKGSIDISAIAQQMRQARIVEGSSKAIEDKSDGA